MMEDNVYGSVPERGQLLRVKEGMKVFDSDNNEVGKVDFIRFGEVSDEALDRGRGPAGTSDETLGEEEGILEDFAFGGAGTPEEIKEAELIRARMLRSGYIRINASGLFASDRYVLPENIASIDDESIKLNIHKDKLLKRS
jgi:hypothetical protein